MPLLDDTRSGVAVAAFKWENAHSSSTLAENAARFVEEMTLP